MRVPPKINSSAFCTGHEINDVHTARNGDVSYGEAEDNAARSVSFAFQNFSYTPP